MINDNLIEVDTAKCFCIFYNSPLKEILDGINELAKKNKNLNEAAYIPNAFGIPVPSDYAKAGLQRKPDGSAPDLPNEANPLYWIEKGLNWLGDKLSQAALIYIAFIVAKYTITQSLPSLRELYKYIVNGRCLMKCDFEANDKWYRVVFEEKSMKWMLKYKTNNIFAADKGIPPEDDVHSFFQTKFMKKFSDQCVKFTEKYLNETSYLAMIACMEKEKVDKKIVEEFKSLYKNKDKLISNMKNLKYSMI